MSGAPDFASVEHAIDLAATELSRGHALADGPPDPVPSWARLGQGHAWLARARRNLANPERHASKAAEWLLDNEYLIHRALLQIEHDLPPGYYRQLPALASPPALRPPRILAVVREMVDAAHLQLSPSTIRRFIETYQRAASPLTTAELWAVPTALRLTCLDLIFAATERLIPALAAPFETHAAASEFLDDTECIARALGNLRVIASISWKDFFEATSAVEAILETDPARVYPRMDFETADRYRRVIESLSRATPHSETAVAHRVIAFCERFAASDPRRGHVGYWLIDAGREEFEASLGYRVPARMRVQRAISRHAVALYALALASAMSAFLAVPLLYLSTLDVDPVIWLVALLVAALPASVLGVTVVHWALTQAVPPRILPKLEFEGAIPEEYKTAVVVPCLVRSAEEVEQLLENVESHYLGDSEAALEFVLLSDFADASQETMPGDAAILDALVEGIEGLNARYGEVDAPRFHALHRRRLYNPAERCWMAWERKRGKLEQFNRLLEGNAGEAFFLHVGQTTRLRGVRYVVTLDSDTIAPRGAVRRLAGILAHPLNRAQFDPSTGRVVTGYTIVQPRVEIEPTCGNRSRFTRLFAGDTAIDIYSRAVSDIYQDLFGAGIYVGKGIYEVATFQRSLEGCVPENALASHDLFEGIHGRAALATDVVLYESFPLRYLEFTRRLHRWIRGDWQLLPWLMPWVPGEGGDRRVNRLAPIDRWKIVDNLRRSLLAPSLVGMLAVGWLYLPGSPWVWTLLGVLAPAGHLFTDLVTGFARGRRRTAVRSTLRRFKDHAGRWLLLVIFLPHEAWVSIDAITRTMVRLLATRRHLLEWTTAAQTARHFEGSSDRSIEWRAMIAGPLIATGLFAALLWVRSEALPSAAALLGAWWVSPEVAFRLGFARDASRPDEVDAEDRLYLRRLARRTWLYFETFAGPEDQWLPPDNFQEDPGGIVAHRTSPTNIGMLLLSTLSAWDLGYLGSHEFASRLANAFSTLQRLHRYRGHLLNWYDTRSLEPLNPRYVSTVDSGNLAASLLALKEGCLELADGPPVSAARWDGLVDMLALLEEDLERWHEPDRRERLRGMLRDMESHAELARSDPSAWSSTLASLTDGEGRVFEDELRLAVGQTEGELELAVLRDIRIWLDRVHHQIREMAHELETLVPWSSLFREAPEALFDVAVELEELLPLDLPMLELPERMAEAQERLIAYETSLGRDPWIARMRDALSAGAASVERLRRDLIELASIAEREALSMDFRWLYDSQTRLFYIGYNVSADQLDAHHYDLLASEARTASLVAIAKGDVPLEHWFHLGRGITEVGDRHCLVSWGGSMFEYLMPSLLFRSEPGTLLAQSECAAVEAHRRFGESQRTPWGISESGFASLDADRNYRYRAFGVPGLGLRRDLAEDRVVAPYATVLAYTCDAKGALENLRRLMSLGLLGEYGLYEALDFTTERMPEGRDSIPVRSYMAHHQGMILAALDNALRDDALIRRMRADPRVRSVELLLHERVPSERPLELLHRAEPADEPAPKPRMPEVHPWAPDLQAGPSVHWLGNGRLSTTIDSSGGGGLRWQDQAVTRFSNDPAREGQGFRFYFKDEESGEQWPGVATARDKPAHDASVVFHAHMAEFRQRRQGIGLHMEVVVAPGDDVELRRFTVVNESDRPRSLTVTSYAEIVLAPARDDERHPAFSKLFVRSEWIEKHSGLLFTRRARDPGEKPPVLMHRLVADSPGVSLIGYEGDRSAFVGRGRDTENPEGCVRSAETSTGFTLDPVASLCVRIELLPNETRQLAFLMFVAGSRESILEAADRYRTPDALDWVVMDAEIDASRRTHQLGLDPAKLPMLQGLATNVMYPQQAWRCDPRLMRENRLGQPRLWGLGISGDLPILLVKTSEPEDAPGLRDLVAGHRSWREHGFAVDLVILSESASGYNEPVGERLRGLLSEHGDREQLGRRGGLHFVAADRISPEDSRLLEVTARVVIDARTGSLEDWCAVHELPDERLPVFSPSRWEADREPTPPIERPGDLRFDNGLGGFSPDGREYVIYLEPGQATPAPWANVLANDQFGCLVTESGGGYSWAVNSGENRLTPWTNDPVSDGAGEALFVRDEETGVVVSPTPAPAGQEVAHEIRHGAGWTRWSSNAEGLAQTLRVFVPVRDPVKLVHLRVRNLWNRPRRITATYYAEWVLGSTRTDSAAFLVPEYDPAQEALLVRNAWSPEFAERVAFLAASRPLHGLTADREEFLGRAGSLRAPAALRRWGLSGRVEPGRDVCGAVQVHLELEPGEECDVHFVLGQGADRAESLELARYYRDPDSMQRAFADLRADWEAKLESVVVQTPDEAIDFLLNRWLLYQAMSSRLFARSGFYQSGGAYGFRDQLQDALCLIHVDADRLRSHLLECAARQFEQGDVLHWWHPPSGRGVRTRCSDDLLWLPYATAAYVEATGDESILEEQVPYLDGAPLGPEEAERYAYFRSSGRSGSLFEHCARAIERGVTRGPHDLPLIGTGDWNDGMNRVGAEGTGESIWLAWFAVSAIRGFGMLCEARGEGELARHWRGRSAEISRAVETHGWDGEWYRRAVDDQGRFWGSRESDECRIDSIAQSWSVLSGAADPDRARRAVLSADSALVRSDDSLARLLSPPFDHTLRDPGYIKAYPPGIRENGGQYTHAATWLAWAFLELDEPNRAMEIFERLSPIRHALDPGSTAVYRVEPYVVAADIAGVAPHVGRGGWTWYTGAAAWTWRLGVEGILGVRRVKGGVTLSPCIPTHWRRAAIRVRGPSGALEIEIEDPEGVGHGVVLIEVDGKPIQGNFVPLPTDRADQAVRVRLGR